MEIVECEDKSSLDIWMVYYPEGNLRQHMSELRPQDKVQLLLQCLAGLRNAHGMNIVHRDIKPEKILVEMLSPLKFESQILVKQKKTCISNPSAGRACTWRRRSGSTNQPKAHSIYQSGRYLVSWSSNQRDSDWAAGKSHRIWLLPISDSPVIGVEFACCERTEAAPFKQYATTRPFYACQCRDVLLSGRGVDKFEREFKASDRRGA